MNRIDLGLAIVFITAIIVGIKQGLDNIYLTRTGVIPPGKKIKDSGNFIYININ
jgi:hypothetical protein